MALYPCTSGGSRLYFECLNRGFTFSRLCTPATIKSCFRPPIVRELLPGFAYQCGVLLAGSVGFVEARFAEHTSYANAMALTAAAVFAFAMLMTALGREQHGVRFGKS